jgi:hypothetical protein
MFIFNLNTLALETASRIVALASDIKDICIGFHFSFFASILASTHLETLIILCFHRTFIIDLISSEPFYHRAHSFARSSTIESTIEANQTSIEYLPAT